MSTDVNHIAQVFPARLWVCILLLVALIFGQFIVAAHAHEDHDHDVPVACDICLASYTDEDDGQDIIEDVPEVLDPPAYIQSSSLFLSENVIAPNLGKVLRESHLYTDFQVGSRTARAPPI